MAVQLGKTKDISFSVNILVKKEDNLFVAHCLELDIVAVATTKDQAQRELVSLICAQIDYAFSNDNIGHLFHPAPQEIWTEFYACKEQMESKYKIESTFQKSERKFILPPWLIAKTCQPNDHNLCHA